MKIMNQKSDKEFPVRRGDKIKTPGGTACEVSSGFGSNQKF